MVPDTITRAEHEEFKLRMEEENHRQNHRLDALEETAKQIHSLATSVEKLALSVQNMAEAQKTHSSRLETLEKRDGEMWRKVVGYVLTAFISAGATLLLAWLSKL